MDNFTGAVCYSWSALFLKFAVSLFLLPGGLVRPTMIWFVVSRILGYNCYTCFNVREVCRCECDSDTYLRVDLLVRDIDLVSYGCEYKVGGKRLLF